MWCEHRIEDGACLDNQEAQHHLFGNTPLKDSYGHCIEQVLELIIFHTLSWFYNNTILYRDILIEL